MLNSLEVKLAQLDALNSRHEQLMRDVKSLTSSITQFRNSMKSLCSPPELAAIGDPFSVQQNVNDKNCNNINNITNHTNYQDEKPRLSLEDMTKDFDYYAKPSVDAILSSSHPSSLGCLDEPLRPTSYVSQTNLNGGLLNLPTNLSSHQCTSLPQLQHATTSSLSSNHAMNGPKTSSDLF